MSEKSKIKITQRLTRKLHDLVRQARCEHHWITQAAGPSGFDDECCICKKTRNRVNKEYAKLSRKTKQRMWTLSKEYDDGIPF